MEKSTIYSTGHGNKSIDVFIRELYSFNIEYLLDIRSKPFSKWNPQFNQASLKLELEKCGITYVFVGDSLGGLPEDRSCYDSNGKILYDVIKGKDFFLQGLKRLITANEKAIKLAIMCSESKPEECHRSKLIGEELRINNISLNHIISENRTKSQETIMCELTKGNGIVDLFGNKVEFTSRKSY
ncbi:DUF488 domain-containing protein [Dysgonomonas macrotermitis]|uniref:DUF488 domain-containing protein n=1 Tax=Dysgonomonas macrotermitis TaxID=1346286 RepID=A0A1M4WM60_9BACT|nr:DUF488 domain-containing protein [Dysgonomonas macrotermitis]SHE82391.1 Protein of unknown function, DUF488 [Dysgonomonas macrotermitis]